MAENDSWAFGDWWSLLNGELADRKQSEALYKDARYYHTANYSPATAAALIESDRREAELLANHEFASYLGSEFCAVCGRSCIGHD